MAAAQWENRTLVEGGAIASRCTVTGESVPKVVMGQDVTIGVEEGVLSVLAALYPDSPYWPAHRMGGLSMVDLGKGLYAMAEKVYALKLIGKGTATVFAVSRR